MSKQYLTVTRLGEIKQDKNTRNYRQVFMQGPGVEYITLPNGKTIEAKTAVKETSINAYEQSYLDDKPEFAWNLKPGDMVLGSIATRAVEPYAIPTPEGEDRIVDTYSRIVFGDTSNAAAYEAAVNREFKAQGHEVVSNDIPQAARTVTVDTETGELFGK